MLSTTKTISRLDIVQQLLADRPSFHLGGTAHWASLKETLHALRDSVQPGDVTIETGVGASTVVFTAAGARHTAISPDPREHELVRAYCRRLGLDDTDLTFVAGSSEEVLPSLLTREPTLDVGFIDGAHSFPFPEVDWCYITRSLKLGGKLILDDITIPTVEPVYRHMSLEPNWRRDGLLDNRGAAFTLLYPPRGDDFWPAQRMNASYPDFSFAPPARRLQLVMQYRVTATRRWAARRSPRLAELYKNARGDLRSEPQQ